jgi:hypothetical protein
MVCGLVRYRCRWCIKRKLSKASIRMFVRVALAVVEKVNECTDSGERMPCVGREAQSGQTIKKHHQSSKCHKKTPTARASRLQPKTHSKWRGRKGVCVPALVSPSIRPSIHHHRSRPQLETGTSIKGSRAPGSGRGATKTPAKPVPLFFLFSGFPQGSLRTRSCSS